MADEEQVPRLVTFLYGEAAGPLHLEADPRLERWARALEEWLGELLEQHKPSLHKQAQLAWRRLVRQAQKGPWELETADIERHTRWMEAEGYARSTIANWVGLAGKFYRWAEERQVDPECGAGFNPAAGVQRPKIKRYETAKLLSRGEAEALLKVMRQDESPLGRRDYAFMLARLRMGAPLSSLQHLSWEQIEVDKAGAWVRWRPEGPRVELPGEAWEAIRAYLQASGRLESMQAGKYVFAPLRNPGRDEARDTAEAWVEERCLSASQILANLKLYGKLAGIGEEKLTLMTLRRTAMRLKLEEGKSVAEMQSFLDSREGARMAKFRLGKLPELPEEERGRVMEEMRAPVRTARPFKPGEGMTHGMFMNSQPPQEVMEILKEDLHGVEEEIAGLRTLARKLMDLQEQAASRTDLIDLMEAYTRAAYWLEVMLRLEAQLKAAQEQDRQHEGGFAETAAEFYESPEDEWQAEFFTIEPPAGSPEQEAASRRVLEEVASIRLVLRRTFFLAGNSERVAELVRLADLYGRACVRLVKLLNADVGLLNNEQVNHSLYLAETIIKKSKELGW